MNMTSEMERVPVEKLIPYINNARTHSPEQIKKLRASLREFGFVNPVIIDRDYNVIAGHGRIMAAKEEGITEVPCVYADHLTEAQKKAYILADNRMALDAGWDEEMLRVEIEALQEMDYDPLLTGFDEKELAALFKDDGEEAPPIFAKQFVFEDILGFKTAEYLKNEAMLDREIAALKEKVDAAKAEGGDSEEVDEGDMEF